MSTAPENGPTALAQTDLRVRHLSFTTLAAELTHRLDAEVGTVPSPDVARRGFTGSDPPRRVLPASTNGPDSPSAQKRSVSSHWNTMMVDFGHRIGHVSPWTARRGP
jgi:hypothetical protein